VGFDVLTTCQPSTLWCSRERLPAAAAQPAKARQSCSASDYYLCFASRISRLLHTCLGAGSRYHAAEWQLPGLGQADFEMTGNTVRTSGFVLVVSKEAKVLHGP
jgi:hypothetical protein